MLRKFFYFLSFNNLLYFLLGGCILGIILSYILKRRKKTVANAQDIKSQLNLTFLGYIFHTKNEKKYQNLFDLREKIPGLKNSFLKLKELLISFSSEKNPLKVLGVTSACSQERKSFCSINLAISCAEGQENTLFINTDLRQEISSCFLETKNHKGLTDFISGNCSFQEAIISTKVDYFSFLPRGSVSSDPQELLKSAKFNDLIEEAKRKFKRIIINLPPVLPCADLSFVGSKCDGVVLVVLAKAIHLDLLLKAKKILSKKTKIMGAVLNKAA
ncbi:MAG: CpsD/CapB family tyrosine-protein kinase [Candidatus Omnitrophica bacterium]|nr:CpsD/CapB family tyrosine-protein kinase [Candidatus Omnitrophota bacterium]